MKKIVTAFNSINAPWHIIALAVKFAKDNTAGIQALFLDKKKEKIDAQYPFPNDLSEAGSYVDESISDSNNEITEAAVKIFTEECESAEIPFSADKNISVQQLINQTLEADLLIVHFEADFLQNILPHIHCPAFVASESAAPQKVVLMYDGNASAKLAIETYISLFSSYKNLPTYLLSINSEREDQTENENFFKELHPYFTDFQLKSLQGNIKDETKRFIADLSDQVLVVMGAFGRSNFSRFFHQSLANIFLDINEVSLFIAHK